MGCGFRLGRRRPASRGEQCGSRGGGSVIPRRRERAGGEVPADEARVFCMRHHLPVFVKSVSNKRHIRQWRCKVVHVWCIPRICATYLPRTVFFFMCLAFTSTER